MFFFYCAFEYPYQRGFSALKELAGIFALLERHIGVGITPVFFHLRGRLCFSFMEWACFLDYCFANLWNTLALDFWARWNLFSSKRYFWDHEAFLGRHPCLCTMFAACAITRALFWLLGLYS